MTARRWRVFHPELPADPGSEFALEATEAHHVRTVLRLGAGECVGVFDGAGIEWEARLAAVERGGVTLRLERRLDGHVDPDFEVVLFQGLCRPDRIDWIVQKATEIGVNGIRLVAGERGRGHRPTAQRMTRWRRIALEACKQSGRRRLPGLEVVDGLAAPQEGADAVLLDPAPEAPPLSALWSAAAPPRLWIAVGPESGFGAGEVERAARAGWRPARLGPRILRTETAGLVAASLALYRWGDLGSARFDSDHLGS